jgi:hypothetical protein
VLQQVAKDHGLKVEKRPVLIDEVASCREVAACGTAVVLTPVNSYVAAIDTRNSSIIMHKTKFKSLGGQRPLFPLLLFLFSFFSFFLAPARTRITHNGRKMVVPGFQTLQQLRNSILDIQNGDAPDKHGWLQDI